MEKPSRGFREGLRRALPGWRAEGLVTPDAARTLEARYDLAAAELAGPGLLPVYVLGAVLVGAGVVSLVAWHWDELGRAAQLAILLAAMVAIHAGALALARRGAHPRVAEALSLLGTLVFGANIALVAQIFQVSGPWYGIFGAFAAGAFLAGLVLDSAPTLAAAAISGLFLWAPGLADDRAWAGLAAAYAVAALVLALAWRRRCPLLVVLGGAGLAISLTSALHEPEAVFPPLAIAAALAAVPLAAPRGADRLAAAARVLGRLGFYAIAYAISFSDLARNLRFHGGMGPLFLVATLPAAALAALLLGRGLRREDVDPLARGEAMLIGAAVPGLLAGLSLRTGLGAAVLANMALVFLAFGRIVRGLSWLRRGPFWEGIALAALLVLARFFEIEELLWLKGAVFIGCGVGVLLAGAAFERRLARRGAEVASAR